MTSPRFCQTSITIEARSLVLKVKDSQQILQGKDLSFKFSIDSLLISFL
ncbi:hypothetical protein ACFLTQ_00170 [Chloroflexota bacterium]